MMLGKSAVSGLALLFTLGVFGCDQAEKQLLETRTAEIASLCKLPPDAAVTTILQRDDAVLETWAFRLEHVVTQALPDAPVFAAYRAAIERDGADVVRPVADPPIIRTDAEAAMWADEFANNDVVFSGAVGSIDAISCLDALLFVRQAERYSPIDNPTEFLASVLRREAHTGPDLVVVFGAGSGAVLPKDVYGFDVVSRYLADGWSFWYTLHNHPVQRNGELLALGVPAPSTNDVQLSRNLGTSMGLESVRVTNGFYTFSATVDELSALRSP